VDTAEARETEMTPKDFVEGFFQLKQELLDTYFKSQPDSAVGAQIASLCLSPSQQATLKEILDGALNDALYTVLLGLDGEASIGGVQEAYELYDESGNLLTGGEIEGWAGERFNDGG
jgi:hypothetical protein